MYFDAKEFGKRLHDVRTSRGIPQEELAVRLGLASKQHVSRMENGERSCSIDLLIELSCLLHVSTDYLLMGSEPSKEEVKNDLLSIISELSTIANLSRRLCRLLRPVRALQRAYFVYSIQSLHMELPHMAPEKFMEEILIISM